MQPDERAWNSALRAWFYRPDLAGRGAYLAVDEEILTAIAAEKRVPAVDATQSLCEAVRYRVSSQEPLRAWTAEAARWRGFGGHSDPPFLGILAVTVLAATIEDGVTDRSYYRRLNDLLHLPGNSMPRYFDNDVQQLWTYLNEWLDDTWHGELGTSTATNIGGQANVGWAQSQILLRPGDRAKLPLFFSELGLSPGQIVDGDLLVRRLRTWSADGRTVSRRLATVLHDTRLSELLANALHSELAHWDGTLRDEVGRLALKLLLAFHERSGQLEIASQVPEQLAGTSWEWRSTASETCTSTLGSAGELQLLARGVTSQLLDGAALQARPLGSSATDPDETASAMRQSVMTLLLPRRDLHLLCPDDRLARWVEVPVALSNRQHLVLVRKELADRASLLMHSIGTEVQSFTRIRLPTGWVAYKFRPDRVQRIDGPLAALSPRGNELSALEGGLPISKRQRVYLRAGAPDLILDLQDRSGGVMVDNFLLRPDAEGRLRLADLGLAVGKHDVSVGGVHYQVTLVDEFADRPFNGIVSFAFSIVDENGGGTRTVPAGMTASAARHDSSDVLVKGASISTSSRHADLRAVPRPPRLRAGGQHFVLGQPGEVAALSLQPPKWLESLSVRLFPHLVDTGSAFANLPFSPSWLMRVTQGWVTVAAIHLNLDSSAPSPPPVLSPDLWSNILPRISDAIPDSGDATAWSAWKNSALSFSLPDDVSK
jgi:hypothetical protein